MLLLTAITALTLFVVVLLGGPARAAGFESARPDTLAYCSDILTVAADGDGIVSVTAVLGRVSSMDLLLPCQYEGGRDHQIVRGPALFAPGPRGDVQPLVDVLGRPHWNLRLAPGAAAGDTVVLTAVVPGWYDPDASRREFGVHALARSWVNTSRFVMEDFRLGLVLPPGLLVDAVGATTPAYNANRSPQPPYTVGRDGDRGTCEMRAAALAPSGRVALALEARPARRGPVPLIAGLVLAILYLVFFRDVLKPSPRP